MTGAAAELTEIATEPDRPDGERPMAKPGGRALAELVALAEDLEQDVVVPHETSGVGT